MTVQSTQLDTYSQLKAEKRAQVYRDPLGETQFVTRTFAPDGSKVRSTDPIDLADVEAYRADLDAAHAKRMASIDELIADIKALPPADAD